MAKVQGSAARAVRRVSVGLAAATALVLGFVSPSYGEELPDERVEWVGADVSGSCQMVCVSGPVPT